MLGAEYVGWHPMIVERIEIRGGFLDGLDLSFARGLNVLIGSRGAGKTSVLELIRFTLGVPAMTSDAQDAADRQARAVLGDGTASVYCTVQGRPVVLTRSGLDDPPASADIVRIDAPLIVSQNEIEAIGLDPASRRSILDALVELAGDTDEPIDETRRQVRRLQGQVQKLRSERDDAVERLQATEGVAARLAEAEQKQAAAAQHADQARPLQRAAALKADELGRVRSTADALRLTEGAIREWRLALTETKLAQPLPELPSGDTKTTVTDAIRSATRLVSGAVDELEVAESVLTRARTTTKSTQDDLQQQLKLMTARLEDLQAGAGEQSQRVSALRQQLVEREACSRRVSAVEAELDSVRRLREVALDDLERESGRRFELRQARAAEITGEFKARLEVRVDKAGELSIYEAALTAALQGSNLQYKTLAHRVARNMSPRELVSAVENFDAAAVEKSADVSKDRATRLVSHLAGERLDDILAARLDDAVDFALLDGQDYKGTRHLSMGQRCTIVLPLLLAEQRESILLDQPEDHLDNAFIVDTLIQAIRERTREGQVIVATHNANIPRPRTCPPSHRAGFRRPTRVRRRFIGTR